MQLTDIITIIISSLALIISIISAVITYKQNYNINQYEFISKEKTKEDIMKLFAALHLIIDKTIVSHVINVDILKEKEIIQEFLLSDTWVAIKYITKDDQNSIMIITQFLLLLYSEHTRSAGETALMLEKDISKICEIHLSDILKEKNRLKKNLNELKFGSENTFTEEWYETHSNIKEKNEKKRYKELLFLKNEKGILDHNIDFWIGVLGNDVEIAKEALDNGADINIPLETVLEQYKEYL